MRGRPDGFRGRGNGGFVPRGGRGDFHGRDRFPPNNFNHPDEGGPGKMPGLFDRDQHHHRGGGGRMPFPGSNDDRYRPGGPKGNGSDQGPPPLLDFPNDKPNLPASGSGNALPSLFSVQMDNPGNSSPLIDRSTMTFDVFKEVHPIPTIHTKIINTATVRIVDRVKETTNSIGSLEGHFPSRIRSFFTSGQR